MALESSLWDWLKKVRKLTDRIDINRIENSAGAGMPDVEGYVGPVGLNWEHGEQFWLELKSAKRPARAETPIRFKVRDKQVTWCNRRWSVGGKVFFLCQVGHGPDRCVYAVPGCLGGELQQGMTESRLKAVARNADCYRGRLDPLTVIVSILA